MKGLQANAACTTFCKSLALSALLPFLTLCSSSDSDLRLSNVGEPYPISTDADSGDINPPVISSEITYSGISQTELTVSWSAAADDQTAAEKLQYKLVTSSDSESINSLDKIKALDTGFVAMDFTENVLHQDCAGLSAKTSYSFAVVVRDIAGNESLYLPKLVETLQEGIVPDPQFSPGDLITSSMSLDVTLSNSLSAAFLCYTINDQAPTVDASSCGSNSTLLNNGDSLILNSEGQYQIQAIAAAAGYADSQVISGLYTLDSIAPVLTCPAGGCLEVTEGSDSFGIHPKDDIQIDDNFTADSAILWKIVASADQDELLNISFADELTGQKLIQDYTTFANLGRGYTVALPDFTFYIAVIAKDEAGNKVISSPQQAADS